MDFYNFFSFNAKKAIYRASEICGQFNNQYLEPEHVFYSILNLRACSATQVLHQVGVNLPKLTYSLEAYLYEHAGSYKGNAVFSQRTITLLDAAYKEVKRLHHKEIGTTHLLITLSQDRSMFLKNLFEEHGLDSKKIRDAFLTHLKGYSQPEQSGIEIKRGQSAAAQIVPPVTYDDIVKQILKNAEFTAQALGYEQLTPAHLLYSSCLYAVEWWDQFAAAGVEPHTVSGKLARMMRKDNQERADRLTLSPQACDVFGRAYGLTLRSGMPSVSPVIFLQAVLEGDDPQIAQVFEDAPEARRKLIELLSAQVDNPLGLPAEPASVFDTAQPPVNPQGYREAYEKMMDLLNAENKGEQAAMPEQEAEAKENDEQSPDDEPYTED